MTSCSHQKIFVASLSSIDNPAEKLKKIEGGKIVFFWPNSVDVVLCQCSVKIYL